MRLASLRLGSKQPRTALLALLCLPFLALQASADGPMLEPEEEMVEGVELPAGSTWDGTMPSPTMEDLLAVPVPSAEYMQRRQQFNAEYMSSTGPSAAEQGAPMVENEQVIRARALRKRQLLNHNLQILPSEVPPEAAPELQIPEL